MPEQEEPHPILMPAELPRQLTTDAVVAAIDGRMTTVERTLRDIRREQREDHDLVRQDMREIREVMAQTLQEVRAANALAADAKRLGDANASDIALMQTKQGDMELALAVLPEGGGLKALVKRVLDLGRSHEDKALESKTRWGLLKTQWNLAKEISPLVSSGLVLAGGAAKLLGLW